MSGRGASRFHRLKKMQTGPYWEGVAAFELGKPRAPPYAESSGSRGKAHAWRKGWNEARRVADEVRAKRASKGERSDD
jgi:hypothetical protein